MGDSGRLNSNITLSIRKRIVHRSKLNKVSGVQNTTGSRMCLDVLKPIRPQILAPFSSVTRHMMVIAHKQSYDNLFLSFRDVL